MKMQILKKLALKDKLQAKALSNLARYGAIILVFSIVSRGTASALMPTVTLCSTSQGSITQSLQAQGVVTTAQGLPFTTQEGILIEQVLVQNGAEVAEGQAIAAVSSNDVKAELSLAKAQLAVLQTQYSQQIKAEPTDSYTVAQAQAALDKAYELYNSATNEADKAAALQQAQAAEAARNSAVHFYEQALEQANKANALNSANAKVTLTQIDNIKAEIKALEEIKGKDYNICAPTSGVVTELRLTAGDKTTQIGGFISREINTSIFSLELPQESAEKVAIGNEIIITQDKLKKTAVISSILPTDKNGNVTLKVILSNTSFRVGTANGQIILKSTTYDMCLPIGAVHMDNKGGFVYVLEESVGVLGVQSVARRVYVTQQESSDASTAILGALSGQSKVILSSSRLLQDGARVKVIS